MFAMQKHRTTPRAALAYGLALSLLHASPFTAAQEITVVDAQGKPLQLAMVTRSAVAPLPVDASDNGYPQAGRIHTVLPQLTRFTGETGKVHFSSAAKIAADIDTATLAFEVRVRKQGYADARQTLTPQQASTVRLSRISDIAALAATKPANLWLSQLSFDWYAEPAKAREHFLLHCAYCHQQASEFMRTPRSEEQWLDVINRMNIYGAQLAADFVAPLAKGLATAFPALQEAKARLPDFEAWQAHLNTASISEWPLGDGMSQMHDFIVHPNGKVYVGDNLMDRIYAVNPDNGEYQVFKVPHDNNEKIGGILGSRFSTYPKVENYYGVHSFALSNTDGHLFITPSMQQALLEFDPATGAFTTHRMDEGYYPHTVRIDARDQVWFTLALSSQVTMFDRKRKTFTYYSLPPRNLKERLTLAVVKWRLGRGAVSNPPDYDWDNNGFPMPYGIDISPLDGSVWVGRLYADDIARIDPDTGKVTMIETPFEAPRRLRCDADGNVWIVSFSTGRIAKYDVKAQKFKLYDLPVRSETPYALNVDRERGRVWVNGNQSDTLMAFDIASEQWRVYPMSKRRTFTRDIEFGEDGSVYTSNSNFPSWQIEGGQPTLIRLDIGSQAQ